MEMRARRTTFRPDERDLLAALTVAPTCTRRFDMLSVLGHAAVVVLDADPLAVALRRTGRDDLAGHDREDRRADLVGEIDAIVRAAEALRHARIDRARATTVLHDAALGRALLFFVFAVRGRRRAAERRRRERRKGR